MIQTRLGYFMGYPGLAVPIPETSCAYPGGLRVLGSSVRTHEAISPPDFDGNHPAAAIRVAAGLGHYAESPTPKGYPVFADCSRPLGDNRPSGPLEVYLRRPSQVCPGSSFSGQPWRSAPSQTVSTLTEAEGTQE